MFTLANKEDQELQERELKKSIDVLKQQQHMLEIRKYAKRHEGIKKNAVLKRLKKALEDEIELLEPSIKVMACPQNVKKDSDISNYLVYLLQMKDFYSSEVATRQEMIKQRKVQIAAIIRQLEKIMNEYSRKIKQRRHRAADFVKIDMYSRRLEHARQKLGMLRKENEDVKEEIRSNWKFRCQYLRYFFEYASKIKIMREERAVQHLEAAVNAYYHREDLMNKAKMMRERIDVDVQRALVNESMLHLSLEKMAKHKLFRDMQKTERVDRRIQATSEMMTIGVTGLEPAVDDADRLFGDIMDSSGTEDLQELRDEFRRKEDQAFGLFTYLGEIEYQTKELESQMSQMRREIKSMESGISAVEKRSKKEMADQMLKVTEVTEEVRELETKRDAAQQELEELLAKIGSLFKKCGSEDKHLAAALEHGGIHESSIGDFLESIECKIIEWLMLQEYIKMNEGQDEPVEKRVESEEDLSEGIEGKKQLDDVEPRPLQPFDSKTNLDFDENETFLTMDELMVNVTKFMAERNRVNDSDEE